MARFCLATAAVHAATAVAVLMGLGIVSPVAAQNYCQDMRIQVTASRKAAAQLAGSQVVNARIGHKTKVLVTVTNANTTHGIASATIALALPAGVAYLQALPDKGKDVAAVNGSVLPAPANDGLVWHGIGPLPASSGSGQAKSRKGGSVWSQVLELWPQACAPSSDGGLELLVSGVATLAGGAGTCNLLYQSATLSIQQPRGKKAAVTCSDPLPLFNVGVPCTQNAQCSTEGRSACIDGVCVAATQAVGQPCTQDNQCGSGNNCINGFCKYCARAGQGCDPPNICPDQWCDTGRVFCSWRGYYFADCPLPR